MIALKTSFLFFLYLGFENPVTEKSIENVLGVLAFYSCENIPVILVGKVCSKVFGTHNSKCLTLMVTLEAIFHLNRVYNHFDKDKSVIHYPNGFLNTSQSRREVVNLVISRNNGEYAHLAISAVLALISADNRRKDKDDQLIKLLPHIKSLQAKSKLHFSERYL